MTEKVNQKDLTLSAAGSLLGINYVKSLCQFIPLKLCDIDFSLMQPEF